MQLNREDIRAMSPDEIVAAEADGKFDVMLGRLSLDEADLVDRARNGSPLSREDVKRLAAINRHDLIVAASDGDRIALPNPQGEQA